MVQAGGLEPPAYFLGGSRSILMSYACNAYCIKLIALKRKNFLRYKKIRLKSKP